MTAFELNQFRRIDTPCGDFLNLAARAEPQTLTQSLAGSFPSKASSHPLILRVGIAIESRKVVFILRVWHLYCHICVSLLWLLLLLLNAPLIRNRAMCSGDFFAAGAVNTGD